MTLFRLGIASKEEFQNILQLVSNTLQQLLKLCDDEIGTQIFGP